MHLGSIEINQRIHSLATDVALVKKLTESYGKVGNAFGQTSSINTSSANKSLTNDTQLYHQI